MNETKIKKIMSKRMSAHILSKEMVFMSLCFLLSVSAVHADEDVSQSVSDASLPPMPAGEVAPSIFPDPAGGAGNEVSCFDYYRFGSVQVKAESEIEEATPGTQMVFSGTVVNENAYPIVDGSIYVKIFRQDDTADKVNDNTRQNGHALVDQFMLPDQYVLAANAEKPVQFTWNVPMNAQEGSYMVAYYFQSAKRYNLSGLSFTDDVIGTNTHFTVVNEFKTKPVSFDKNFVMLNGQQHGFARFPMHFKKDEAVTVTAKITNPTSEVVSVPVTWTMYSWDGLREENMRDVQADSVSLQPNETKTISYVAKQTNASVIYVVAEANDGDSKSILDIRFVRDGIEETRINFPGVVKYPLERNTENTIFSCVHATNTPLVKNSSLTLSLKDSHNNLIHEYTYTGDVSGAMMGVKDTFKPKDDIGSFTLTAILKKDDQVVDVATQVYDCASIDPDQCAAGDQAIQQQSGAQGSTNDSESKNQSKFPYTFIGVLGALSLLGIVYSIIRKKR